MNTALTISEYRRLGTVPLPEFTGIRVMMMPIVIGDASSIPEELSGYLPTLEAMWGRCSQHNGKVGYVTIDEKMVRAGETHRRRGLHVDGVYHGKAGGWGGGPGGPWAKGGMIIASSPAGCKAWEGTFRGEPGPEGECDHFADQCDEGIVLEEGVAYWMSATCVHESLPQEEDVERQLIRLSFPSDAPWFEGYTENPLGIEPTGPILPRRDEFMDD